MLQHFFNLLGTVAATYLLQDGLPFESVRESGPHEHGCEINAYDVGQGPEFLSGHPQIPAEVTASNRKRGDEVMVAVHHSFITDQVIKYPEHLRYLFVLGLLGVGADAHLQVYLLLQRLGIKLIKKRGLVVLVDALNLLHVLSQGVPPLVQRGASRVQVDAIERPSVVP